MQKLKAANLYRSNLISVSGKLVERYNKCLLKLGFSETKLTSFSIDGIGWSPEISEEKNERFYLNNGEANSHCIIITPLQKDAPIYMPFNSFDKDLMKEVFKIHGDKIKNITRDSAICVDFDQKIDVFYESLDVLRYKDIVIKFHLIDNLDKAKEEQLQLIDTFNSDNNFIDENLHEELIASAKKHGDLRGRDLELSDIHFTTDSFYTEAFGGIYLLRDFVSPILVFKDEQTYKSAIKDTVHDVLMYHISHSELIEKLRSYQVIDCDLEEEVTSKKYDRVKKYLFYEYLDKPKHPIKDILEDSMLFKSYLNRITIEERKKVMSVELYIEKLKINNQYKINDIVDEKLYVALHSPHSSLKPNHQDLIWKLLINISPKDILFLYWYDKVAFYNDYKTWNDSMKDWVIETIRKNI